MWLSFYLHSCELKSCLFSWIDPFVANTSSLFDEVFVLLAQGSKTWFLLMSTRVRDNRQVSPGWERHWRTLLYSLLLSLNGKVYVFLQGQRGRCSISELGWITHQMSRSPENVCHRMGTFCSTVLAIYEVKLSFPTPWRYMGGNGSISPLIVDRSDLSASQYGWFISRQIASGTEWIGGWVVFTDLVWTFRGREKSLDVPGNRINQHIYHCIYWEDRRVKLVRWEFGA
jgi:hypothetical protein